MATRTPADTCTPLEYSEAQSVAHSTCQLSMQQSQGDPPIPPAIPPTDDAGTSGGKHSCSGGYTSLGPRPLGYFNKWSCFPRAPTINYVCHTCGLRSRGSQRPGISYTNFGRISEILCPTCLIMVIISLIIQ